MAKPIGIAAVVLLALLCLARPAWSADDGAVSLAEGLISQAEKEAGDIEATGACKKEIAAYCQDVQSGNRSLERCLSTQVKVNMAAKAKDDPDFSAECLTEVRNFKVALYRDITMDKEMVEACKEDIASMCDDDFLYPEPGNVLACLRESKESGRLSGSCAALVLEAQEDAADDFRMDPQLNALCSKEADRLCADVAPGEGRVQECLRRNRKALNWECQAELFRQEVENADDIRLNVRLFKACLDDKRRFCPDVVPGDARVKDCLEEHRADADFSQTCKTEFDKMMERRAMDFRLDASLRKYCHKDIVETCYPDAEDISDVANWDSKVIECLQDYKDELKDPRCRQQVHKLTKRAAEDVRFDHPLHDACEPDRARLCKEVPTGHARVFTCLQDHRKDLRPICRTALFDQEIRYAGDIDFKFGMRQACAEEMKRLCAKASDTVRCLQDHAEDADMGRTCRDEVKKDEQRSAQDFRLNFRLNKACFEDVQHLCMEACDAKQDGLAGGPTGQPCGGLVLRCLSAHAADVSSPECREEVFYFERREVEDAGLDVPLQRACKDDVETFCGGGGGYAGRDHSKVLSCLRTNRKRLSAKCREEELRFTAMEASDIRLTPTLMNACGLELHQFCKGVQPGGGHAFRCLQWHVQQSGMSVGCRAEVDLQTMRQSQYYRTDIALALQCDEDVEKNCADVEDGDGEGDFGPTVMCLLDKYAALKAGCQSELAYTVRTAMWLFHRGAALTQPCEADIDAVCGAHKQPVHNGPVVGVVGQCLVDAPLSKIGNKTCRQLVTALKAGGGHMGGVMDDNQLEDTLTKIAEINLVAQAEQEESEGEGRLVLTGWVAFVAITALAAVLLAAGFFVYRRYFDPTRNYTVIVKAGDV